MPPHDLEHDNKTISDQIRSIGDGKIGRELFYLIKSRYKIIYIRSTEESRVIDTFRRLSEAGGFDLFQWDASRGLLDSHTNKQVKCQQAEVHSMPANLLTYIIDQAKNDNSRMKDGPPGDGKVFLLLDFHVFLRGDGSPVLQRRFKEFFDISSVTCMVIVAPVFECPVALQKEFTLVDFPYPSKSEYRNCLSLLKDDITVKFPDAFKVAREKEDDILQAVSGLTLVEAENAFALSIVKKRTFDVPTIMNEKKQIIRKGGILEYRDSRFTFDDVGGLKVLKDWLKLRRRCFSDDAIDFGIQPLKGVLLVGTPGCGKSMVADALADYWQMPLLRLDIGSLFSSYIGSSESNVRAVIQTVGSLAPCILWCDEVEKGIGGVRSSNTTDGGVTNRVFGTLLTWMQEKTAPVFIVCTANNVFDLPPEFMRAGRFDEIFFLDLPTVNQRKEVIEKLLVRNKRDANHFDTLAIAQQCDNYSPAEIEKAINNAIVLAYYENKRQIVTEDIVSEIAKFQPLFNSCREDVEKMRNWALGADGKSGRAVLANAEDADGISVSDITKAISGRNLGMPDDLIL